MNFEAAFIMQFNTLKLNFFFSKRYFPVTLVDPYEGKSRGTILISEGLNLSQAISQLNTLSTEKEKREQTKENEKNISEKKSAQPSQPQKTNTEPNSIETKPAEVVKPSEAAFPGIKIRSRESVFHKSLSSNSIPAKTVQNGQNRGPNSTTAFPIEKNKIPSKSFSHITQPTLVDRQKTMSTTIPKDREEKKGVAPESKVFIEPTESKDSPNVNFKKVYFPNLMIFCAEREETEPKRIQKVFHIEIFSQGLQVFSTRIKGSIHFANH